MHRKIIFFLILTLCFLFSTVSGICEERELVPDTEWVPPDLSSVTVADDPFLLVLKVAQNEIGYIEGKSNYSKYGEWFGTPRCQWCAEFLTWCVNQTDELYGTDLLKNIYPYYGKISGADWFIQRGRFISSNGTVPGTNQKQWWPETLEYLQVNEYIPYPGDYMWLYIPDYGLTTIHVAIIEGTSRTENGDISVHVIEGNNPDSVQRAVYLISDIRIFGFGTPVKRMGTEYRLHNKSDDIAQAKTWLKQMGYYTSSDMSVSFTAALQTAIKKFQKANGLTVNRWLDMPTWIALKDAALTGQNRQ